MRIYVRSFVNHFNNDISLLYTFQCTIMIDFNCLTIQMSLGVYTIYSEIVKEYIMSCRVPSTYLGSNRNRIGAVTHEN